ncbi:protein ITPRID2-like isoform X2 [Periophthalmus magnuspinnatus]|uniref:protein ITPRID2 isoform X2 n=1 Tax=Periophthalmus magnuspinnatus TaxID=409849 RepID=UPI002436C6F9|nr:protein ITPRID2 isoform X2 [Periophthalmus magnuspinnatus]XP_055086471.1 protein ITPRID2-like isoform X2 [Periophthalmus magnuspinnatus]
MQGPVDSSGALEPSPPAERRRRLWAQSRESMWQSSPKPSSDQDLSQNQDPGSGQHNGRVPHKISTWLSECRTPIGASLDEHSGSPNRGLRNGCSFEDDLSLGAEANHLQCSTSRSEPGFGLAADQKRSQFKDRARSMNSTGSGKSSTVSSVSELLDLYEEDPEEILMNLGFGREEPDLASKVPSRFFNGSSCARGIDFKVFLGAQLQRLELENPNYALTSRFRQIEVLTSVANEFFQLYSQVSGQPVHRITPRDPGREGDSKEPPAPKKSVSALNAAKLLKKSISKHNLLAQANAQANAPANAPASAQDNTPASAQDNAQDNVQANMHGNAPDNATAQANAAASPQPGTNSSAQGEEGRHGKLKMDTTVLPSVSEESTSDGEPDKDTVHSAEQPLEPATNQSAEVVELITNHSKGEVEQTPNHRTGDVEITASSLSGVEQTANHSPEDKAQTANQSIQPGEHIANHNNEDMEQTTNHSTGDAESTASSKTHEEQTVSHSAGVGEKPANEMWPADRAMNPQLALLRTENADSFDIEEIQSGEDDVPPLSSSRNADLSRTVSQQSDSSGFAEEPSPDSCSFLKVQESSDSCDSETTVTSHPSQDLATPVAVDQPAFALLTGGVEQSKRLDYDEPDRVTDTTIPQYTVHQLPKNLTGPQAQHSHSPTIDTSKTESEEGLLDGKTLEDTLQTPEQESYVKPVPEFSLLGESLDEDRPSQAESPDFVSERSESSLPHPPPSPVLGALHRARLNQRIQGSTRARCGVPLQRSSSLPTTTVVSSVRIHLGRGKAAGTPKLPRDDIDGQGTVNPLRAIPRSSVSSSPPPDWTGGSYRTQSVPELYANHQQTPYQHPPGVTHPHVHPYMYPYGNPYSSTPNLLAHHGSYPGVPHHSTRPEHHPFVHYGHISAPHSSPTMSVPWFGGSYSTLHSSTHTAPILAQNAASYSPYSGQSQGTPTPSSLSHYDSHSHLHHMTPPTLASQPYQPEAPPPHPGFHLGPPSSSLFGGPMFSPEAAVHPHLMSTSEMQLRRVLQEIRGTLHSLGQSRFGSLDVLAEQRAPSASPKVSDLLREQLLLQSELRYHSNSGSPASSCCSSPVRRSQSQGKGHYSASINITPAPPPRSRAEIPQPHPSEEPEEGLHSTEDTPTRAGQGQEPETRPPVDNLEQLIREIRQSVSQEIRREIYNELLASIAPSKQQ